MSTTQAHIITTEPFSFALLVLRRYFKLRTSLFLLKINLKNDRKCCHETLFGAELELIRTFMRLYIFLIEGVLYWKWIANFNCRSKLFFNKLYSFFFFFLRKALVMENRPCLEVNYLKNLVFVCFSSDM